MYARKHRKNAATMLEIIPESHLDHGLTPAHIDFIKEKFADKTGFFIETVQLPAKLPSLQDALYGPLVGDKPVAESAVHYAVRGIRPGESRMVDKPMRETRYVTVIAGPHDGKPLVLYTAFGGKLTPKEPFDPTLNPAQKAESEAFWSQHALATGKQASKRANSSNRKTTQDFTHLSDAELEARVTTASQGMQYWRGYNPSFYDMAEKEWDALTAEKKRRARPNTTVHAHDLDCPSCGAPAGYYCNRPNGTAQKTPHKSRRNPDAFGEQIYVYTNPEKVRAILAVIIPALKDLPDLTPEFIGALARSTRVTITPRGYSAWIHLNDASYANQLMCALEAAAPLVHQYTPDKLEN